MEAKKYNVCMDCGKRVLVGKPFNETLNVCKKCETSPKETLYHCPKCGCLVGFEEAETTTHVIGKPCSRCSKKVKKRGLERWM